MAKLALLLARLSAPAAAAALLAPCAAHAAWLKAETDRFVVYGDVGPQLVHDYAVHLTVYDEALRLLHKSKPAAQKVEVYLVRSKAELKQVSPGLGDLVDGFYSASPQAVFAMANISDREDLGQNTNLFHEYAHHFMLQNVGAAYPAWFVEGWAEYYSTAEIKPRGVTIGGFNEARTGWLDAGWLPMKELLTADIWKLSGEDQLRFYAQAWNFVHYMQDTPQRRAQLAQALKSIASGTDSVKAVEDATGQSLDQLTAALKHYAEIQTVTVPAKMLNMSPQVAVSALPASADDLLLDNLRLEREDGGGKDAAFQSQARAHAALHPGDPLADEVLARIEFADGDVAAGEAVVNRRLAANPNDDTFLRLAGHGEILAGERKPQERAARYRTARKFLQRAFVVNHADFRTLYDYEVSRQVEPDFPSDEDVNILLGARELAPSVSQTAILAAQALIQRGRKPEADGVLAMVANDPHGGEAAAWARAIIAGQNPKDPRSPATAEPASKPSAKATDKPAPAAKP